MTCSCTFIFDELIRLGGMESVCDNCNSVLYRKDHSLGQYRGDRLDGSHIFNVPPFSCLNCRKQVYSFNSYCKELLLVSKGE